MKSCSFLLCKQLLLFGTFRSNFTTITSKIFDISIRDGICDFSFAQLNLCLFANLRFFSSISASILVCNSDTSFSSQSFLSASRSFLSYIVFDILECLLYSIRWPCTGCQFRCWKSLAVISVQYSWLLSRKKVRDRSVLATLYYVQ